MERPVGEIFVYNGKTLEVVEDTNGGCNGCFFSGKTYCNDNYALSIRGVCGKFHRKDTKSVIFKIAESFKFLK